MRVLRTIKWVILLCALLVVGTPLLLLIAAIEQEPQLNHRQYALTQTNVSRIKKLIKDANPRYLRLGESKTLHITEDDANLILSYGMGQLGDGAARVALEPGSAKVTLSLPLQPLLPDRYFNTSFEFVQQANRYTINRLKFGQLPVPDLLSRWLAETGHRLLLEYEPYQVGLMSTEKLELDRKQLQISFYWHQRLKDQVRATGSKLLFKDEEQARIAFYHEQIYQASRSLKRHHSLSALLSRLFAQAAARSTTPEQAVSENRSLLLTLSFYLLRLDISQYISEPSRRLNYFWLKWPTLAHRHDLAQHFGVSAGITAAAGARIAGVAGLFKELKDSQGGSGFSFADLAADQAGSRFAEIALDPNTAPPLQQLMLTNDEELFMPRITNLPEGLQRAEFTRQYANLDNERYRLARAEIDARINARAVYRLDPR